MAANAIAELRGFEEYKLDPFVDEQKKAFEALCKAEGLQCIKCLEVAYTPVRLSVCSHTFCKICLEEALQEEKKCPTCKKSSEKIILRHSFVTRIQQIYEETVLQYAPGAAADKNPESKGAALCKDLFPGKELSSRALKELAVLMKEFSKTISSEKLIEIEDKPIIFNVDISVSTVRQFDRILKKMGFKVKEYSYDGNQFTVILTQKKAAQYRAIHPPTSKETLSIINERDIEKFKSVIKEVTGLLNDKNSPMFTDEAITLNQCIPVTLIDQLKKCLTFCKVDITKRNQDEFNVTLIPPEMDRDKIAQKITHISNEFMKDYKSFQAIYDKKYHELISTLDCAIQDPKTIQSILAPGANWVTVPIDSPVLCHESVCLEVENYLRNRGLVSRVSGKKMSVDVKLDPSFSKMTIPYQYPNQGIIKFTRQTIDYFNSYVSSNLEKIYKQRKFKFEQGFSVYEDSDDIYRSLLLFCNLIKKNNYIIDGFSNTIDFIKERIEVFNYYLNLEGKRFTVTLRLKPPLSEKEFSPVSTCLLEEIETKINGGVRSVAKSFIDARLPDINDIDISSDRINFVECVHQSFPRSVESLIQSVLNNGKMSSIRDWYDRVYLPYTPSGEVKKKLSKMQAEVEDYSNKLSVRDHTILRNIQSCFLSQMGRRIISVPFISPEYIVAGVTTKISEVGKVSLYRLGERVFKLTLSGNYEEDDKSALLEEPLNTLKWNVNQKDIQLVQIAVSTLIKAIQNDHEKERRLMQGKKVYCYFPEAQMGTWRIAKIISLFLRSYNYNVKIEGLNMVVEGVFE